MLSLLAPVLLSLAIALTGAAQGSSCTMARSGGNDAPALLAAAAACSVVTIPAKTTLNITTRLDMSHLQNVHIVSVWS